MPAFYKGQLVPGATYSSTEERFRSTFEYTNAVPQRSGLNEGYWSQFEERIRLYAQQCTQGLSPGTLYLITGTAFGHIDPNKPQGYNAQKHVDQMNNGIYIPNSMWTAGCCVHPNGIESFAVIGNNLANSQPDVTLTQQIPVEQLQDILKDDVNSRGLSNDHDNVDLFPGNVDCSQIDTYDITEK